MRFIGDIHGTYNLREYEWITNDCEKSIQIGDLGLGFTPGDTERMFKNVDRSKHFFIRGNHDNPTECEAQLNHIESGQSDDHGMFFVNGGWSIDGPGAPWCPSYNYSGLKPRRSEGLNWWSDEEHDDWVLEELIQEYEKCKPQIVVTHEAPWTITDRMFKPQPKYISRTADTLQVMLEIHKPEIWIFGHWHKRKDQVIEGTRFICLEECGYIDLDI